MKIKTIKIPVFKYRDPFGTHVFSDVEILFDPTENLITAENFNQSSHKFYLPDYEIDRLASDSMRRFLNKKLPGILNGKSSLSGKIIDAIITFLKVNRSEFSDLIGLDRASITRIINEEQPIKKDVLLLIIERLKDEVESPGLSRIILDKIRNKKLDSDFENLNLDVFVVAEYLIRFFESKEDCLTHLKLQKLLYYAQGIGLGRFNKKLFNNAFFAWDHGPVVQEIYNKYKNFGSAPLNKETSIDLRELESNESAVGILNETISLYGIYSAWTLRNKTHNESPWLDTPQSEIIGDDKFIKFFKNALV